LHDVAMVENGILDRFGIWCEDSHGSAIVARGDDQGSKKHLERRQGPDIDPLLRTAPPRSWDIGTPCAQPRDPGIRVQSDDVFIETRRGDVSIILVRCET